MADALRAVNLFDMVCGYYHTFHCLAHDLSQILDRFDCPEISRLLLRLCKGCDVLPMSLFITGIRRIDTEATYGGGYSDIYKASLRHQIVALKRLRIFLTDQERHKVHMVHSLLSALKYRAHIYTRYLAVLSGSSDLETIEARKHFTILGCRCGEFSERHLHGVTLDV
jgi:hypothetical protein